MNRSEVFDIRLAYEALTSYSTANAISPSKVREGREIRVVCPIHGDDHASMDLDIVKMRFYCRACKAGGDAITLVMAVKNLQRTRDGFKEAFGFLRELSPENVHATKEIVYGSKERYSGKNVVKVTGRRAFHYTDKDGNVKYDVIRIDGFNEDDEPDKDFLQRRKLPDGGAWYDKASKWVFYGPDGQPMPWSATDKELISVGKFYHNGKERRRPTGPYVFNMRGVAYELYRLPEVHAAAKRHERICMVEGEKKNDALRDRTGWCVTTFAGGANAELEMRWIYDLAGAKQLVIFVDSDRAGREAARMRANHFRLGVFDVKLVDCFGDDSKRDIDDWLKERANESAACVTGELEQLIAEAPSL